MVPRYGTRHAVLRERRGVRQRAQPVRAVHRRGVSVRLQVSKVQTASPLRVTKPDSDGGQRRYLDDGDERCGWSMDDLEKCVKRWRRASRRSPWMVECMGRETEETQTMKQQAMKNHGRLDIRYTFACIRLTVVTARAPSTARHASTSPYAAPRRFVRLVDAPRRLTVRLVSDVSQADPVCTPRKIASRPHPAAETRTAPPIPRSTRGARRLSSPARPTRASSFL